MNYNKKTVQDIDVAGKKVLLRCDFNVPMAKDGSGVITDDKRIRAALPTIQYLLDNNAAVIACSHMGKPKGEVKPELSLKPVAARLSQLLGKPVIMADDVVGPDAKAKAAALQPGQFVIFFAAGGQHDHRCHDLAGAHLAQAGHAIHKRHHNIKDHQVNAAVCQLGQRLCAVPGFGTGKARVLQVLADQIPNARFIVNDQYSCHF